MCVVKNSPFQAAEFGKQARWLYHLGITGLSDAFPQASSEHAHSPAPGPRPPAQACEALPGAAPGPTLQCPGNFLYPASGSTSSLESLSKECRFS